MLQLVRLFDELPDGFDDLLAEASGEGVRNMALLAEGWEAGARFQDDSEAIVAVFLVGELAGIGALSVEPATSEPARASAGSTSARPCADGASPQRWPPR